MKDTELEPVQQQSIYETIMSQPPLSSSNYTPASAMHRPVPIFGDSEYSLGRLTRLSLPYFTPWYMTAGPSELPPNFDWLTESCGGRAAIGVFGGGVMGLLMGVFLGAMSDSTPPLTIVGGKEVPQAPMKEQMKLAFRSTWEKSLYWCRNFAFITGVFGGSEVSVKSQIRKYKPNFDPN